MSSPRSSASIPNKSVPAYILDSLRDPDLLADNWYALAELENIRQQAAKESLLRNRYAQPPEIVRYSIAESALPENRAKNRYQNVAPYDLNAVRVGKGDDGKEEGMYLNASWVREAAGGALWIASQAPLPNTHYEFLSLCTDITPAHKRVRTIVQLTPWVERRFQAAHPYIPNEVGESITIDRLPALPVTDKQPKSRLKVTVTGKRHVPEADCIVRNIDIRYEGWSEGCSPVFKVRHLAFDSWADHGVPRTTSSAYWLALLADKENRESDNQTQPPPMIVHCSAGVGRTGTFIAICSLLRAFGLLPPASRPEWDTYVPEQTGLGDHSDSLPADDYVVQEVNALREQRIMMVQMPDQLAFIYELLSLALSKKLDGQ
ncbi:protein-tyrosine phosphatase [Ceratobasidium sp. AG-Ba]|nr:protein-tyrosine phosphatase [Ceratobasidium sp. AG-Ba]